jgi:hypothetical protein
MTTEYHTLPVDDTGGNINYISYDNNQTEITNTTQVQWDNVLSKPTFGTVAFTSEYDSLSNVPFKRNNTNDIIYRGHNVGIGLQEGQSPINKLHLIGDLFITENYDTWDFLRFYHNGDTAFLDFGGVENGVAFRMNTGTTSFENNPSLDEVMRFRNNKIGILKNNPQYSLDVNGSLNTTTLLINTIDINTIINSNVNLTSNNLITYNNTTSNILVNYNNLINKPSFATIAYANTLNSRFFNNNGINHTTINNFNNVGQFGYTFIASNTNSPLVNNATQYYSWSFGLGAEYAYGSYEAQFALPRNKTNPYLCVRYREDGNYGDWNTLSAGYADTAGSIAYANITGKPDLSFYLTYNIASNIFITSNINLITSNNLINYTNDKSTILNTTITTTSNNCINYTNATITTNSNNCINYTNSSITTASNILVNYNNLINKPP